MSAKRISLIRFSIVAACLPAWATLSGCSDSGPPSAERSPEQAGTPPAASPEEAHSPNDPPPREAPVPAKSVPLRDGETWDIYYMQGGRVGYGWTTISHTAEAGRRLVQVEGLNHLVVRRFGQTTEQEIRFKCIETLDGKLIEFQSEIRQGDAPLRTTGKVVGNRLQMETTSRGKKTSTAIAWSPEHGGFYATEESLLRRPMQPGERRTIRALAPLINQVATIELTAGDYEPVKLLGGTFQLLRIDSATKFPLGAALTGTVWSDRMGETLKTRTDVMQLEAVRATKALALEKKDLAQLDLGWDMMIKVNRRMARPHDTKRVRYRLQLEGGDPAEVFAAGPSQHIRSTGPHTAEVTVFALRPDRAPGNPNAPTHEPTDDDRQPNNLIQSDDARIAAMARKAAGDETDPWQVAQRLERYVNELITEMDFSQAFATAAEVAENPSGDCTEHAVLLAALARARGIPARVAVGLVYIKGRQSFGYHMWTEVYVRGRWIPLDATLGRGGIGAAHLKLAHSSLKGASAYSSFLPVIQVIGRLKIDIEQVE